MLPRSSWLQSMSWVRKRAPTLAEPWLMGLIMTTFSLYPLSALTGRHSVIGHRALVPDISRTVINGTEDGDSRWRDGGLMPASLLGSGFVRFVVNSRRVAATVTWGSPRRSAAMFPGRTSRTNIGGRSRIRVANFEKSVGFKSFAYRTSPYSWCPVDSPAWSQRNAVLRWG